MALFNLDTLQTVLFDENRDSAIITKQLLQQTGVKHLRHIRDVEEAMDICFQGKIDILIVDMDDPEGSGSELIRRLRKQSTEKRLTCRILALVGNKEEDVVLEVASCGVDSVILKPIAADSMKTRLKKIYGMETEYLKFDDYFGPDRRIKPDRLPDGENDKRDTD